MFMADVMKHSFQSSRTLLHWGVLQHTFSIAREGVHRTPPLLAAVEDVPVPPSTMVSSRTASNDAGDCWLPVAPCIVGGHSATRH